MILFYILGGEKEEEQEAKSGGRSHLALVFAKEDVSFMNKLLKPLFDVVFFEIHLFPERRASGEGREGEEAETFCRPKQENR